MNTIAYLFLIFPVVAPFQLLANEGTLEINVTSEQVHIIAEETYNNECSSNPENLLFWNKKEDFPSLGIGHFIWFPTNFKAPHVEGFRDFLTFLESKKYPLPVWLQGKPACPWTSRDQFYAALLSKDSKILELKEIIMDTMDLQAEFMVLRFETTASEIYKHLSTNKRAQQAFINLTKTPQGLYALIDYLNFKGSGLIDTETYNGQGWGLVDVLKKMSQSPACHYQPEKTFSQAAIEVLRQRAFSSPQGRDKTFLEGWIKRCRTYS